MFETQGVANSGEVQPRSERVTELYEKVDFKIASVLRLQKMVEDNQNLPPEQLAATLKKAEREIVAQFGDETEKKLARLLLLKEQLTKLSRAIEAIHRRNAEVNQTRGEEMDFEFSEQDQAELDRLDSQRDQVVDEYDALHQSEDLQFLEKVHNFGRKVTRKRQAVLERQAAFARDPQQFMQAINPQLNPDNTQILFSGYAVNIIIDSKIYDALGIYKGSNGFHKEGTIFNYIRKGKDPESVRRTIVHEETHNLTESFMPTVYYREQFVDGLTIAIQRLKRMTEMHAPAVILGDVRKSILKRIEEYASHNSDEILADLDTLAEGNISTYFTNFLETLKDVERLVAGIQDVEMKAEIRESLHKLENSFVKKIRQIGSLLWAAEKFERTDETKAGIVLFHDHLGKAERQLERHVPQYSFYQGFFLLLSEGRSTTAKKTRKMIAKNKSPEEKFISMFFPELHGSIERTVERLASPESLVNEFLAPENIQRIAKARKDFSEVTGLDVKEIEVVKNKFEHATYLTVLKAHPELIEIEPLSRYLEAMQTIQDVVPFADIAEHILNDVIDLRYQKSIATDDFSYVQELWDQWRWDKIILEEALLGFLEHFAVSDYADRGKRYTKRTIKKSSFWKFLSNVGLEKKAEEVLQRQAKK